MLRTYGQAVGRRLFSSLRRTGGATHRRTGALTNRRHPSRHHRTPLRQLTTSIRSFSSLPHPGEEGEETDGADIAPPLKEGNRAERGEEEETNPDQWTDLLTEFFPGYSLKSMQAEVLACVWPSANMSVPSSSSSAEYAGRDCIAIMPTGFGKSLLYQLPALTLSPGHLCLVISPLIALMDDQVAALRARRISAYTLHSNMELADRELAKHEICMQRAQILYCSPEALTDAFCEWLREHAQIALLAIDEAHCISKWGHDFRPAYMALSSARAKLNASRVMALTATASRSVEKTICEELDITRVVRMPAQRPNLELCVQQVPDLWEDIPRIKSWVQQARGSVLIYATTRKDTELAFELLLMTNQYVTYHPDKMPEANRTTISYYHAGLEPSARAETLTGFVSGRCKVVVATIAFGMGVDRADVGLVLHLGIPGSLEAYYQELGRAGRDGQPARCVMLVDLRSIRLQSFFLSLSRLLPKDVHAVWQSILRLGDNPGHGWRKTIQSETGVKNISGCLGVLRRAGSLRLIKPQATFLVGPGASYESSEIKVRGTNLVPVFEYLQSIFERKSTVDVAIMARVLSRTPAQVTAALRSLASKGLITAVAAAEKLVILERGRPSFDEAGLIELDERKLDRWQKMQKFAARDRCSECLWHDLSLYFDPDYVKSTDAACSCVSSSEDKDDEPSEASDAPWYYGR